MTRFSFFTDAHLSGKSPRHRIDDYPQAILRKMAECYQTAKDEDCSFMLFAGDFFNTHRIFSYEVIGDAMDIVEGYGIPTYMCLGEHDLYGHSPATYPTSTLAFFVRRCPSVEVVTKPIEVEGVTLWAKHEFDPVPVINGEGLSVDAEKLNVLICHELITGGKAPFDVVHTSTLADSPFDLVVSGDLHDGYPTHEVNGTWFCNPGALSRQKTNDSHRHPQMAIIEVEKGLDPVIDIRKLKCAQPGEEVFGESITEVVKGAVEEFDGDGFTEEMLQFEADSVDVHELIQNVGKAKGVRDAVLDYLATKKAKEDGGKNDEGRG
jgi:exonuclease SbcD